MSTSTIGIRIELDGAASFQSQMKSLTQELKTFQSQANAISTSLSGNVSAFTQSQTASASLRAELASLKDQQALVAEQIEKVSSSENANQTYVYKLQQQYADLTTKINEVEAELSSLGGTIGAVGTQLEAAGTAITALGTSITAAGVTIAAVGATLTKTVTAAVLALGTAAVTTAADFESSMSKVEALVSSSSDNIESDMEMLEEAARSAGETTIYSTSEAADALYYMGLAGWDAAEMVEGLPAVLNLAAAADMELGTASDIVTDYLTAFGLAAEDAEGFVDQMAYAMSNSNTTVEQLGEAYKNVAATSTQLGYSLEDTTAALMVMADAGIKGGEAGTALASIMTRLGNNTSGCTDMLEEYGIEVYDTEGNVNSLSEILSGLQVVWADLTDEERSNLAYVVAGKTAQAELMTVLGESTGAFEEYREGLASCSGTAEEMAAILTDNLEGQLTILKSQLQELAISFGEKLLPIVSSVVAGLQDLVSGFNSLSDEQQTAIIKALAFAAAIGPLVTLTGALTSAVGAVVTGIGSFVTAIGGALSVIGTMVTSITLASSSGSVLSAVLTALKAGLAAIISPAALVVTAIGSLVAIFATLTATNETFRSDMASLWPEILEIVSGATQQIQGIVESFIALCTAFWDAFGEDITATISEAFTLIQEIISTVLAIIQETITMVTAMINGDWEEAWNSMSQILSDVWSLMQTLVSAALAILQTLIEAALNVLYALWMTVWTGFFTFLSETWDSICTAVSESLDLVSTTLQEGLEEIRLFWEDTWNAIVDFVVETWESICSAIRNAVEAVTEAVGEVAESIKTKFYETVSAAFQWGKDLVENIASGITSAISSVISAVSSVASAIASYLHFSVPDAGPLADMESWMPDMMEGLASGIEEYRYLVRDAAEDAAADISLVSQGLDADSMYSAVREGASDATIVFKIGERELGRVLRGMGVSFA